MCVNVRARVKRKEGKEQLTTDMMSPLKYAHNNNNNMVKVIWIERVHGYDDKPRHMHTFDPSHICTAAFIYLCSHSFCL